MDYVTLTRKDVDFKDHLWGTFSTEKRAVALETFDAFSGRERVTFHILPIEEVKRPAWWKVYLLATRPEMWLLTLGPALSVFLLIRHELVASQWWLAASALLSLIFLHNAACLANDVQDHMSGSDRANRRRGSQVIQRGWSPAFHMARWATGNLVLATLIGLAALSSNPLPLFAVAMMGLLLIALLISARGARFGLADLAVLVLYGPLISVGMALVVLRNIDLSLGLLGIGFGILAMWVLQARQMENLFRSHKESHRTFVGYLDFEFAKLSFVVEGLLALGITVWGGLTLNVHWASWSLLPFAALPLAWVLSRTLRAASPLSSDFIRIGKQALLAHGALTIWWWLALVLL